MKRIIGLLLCGLLALPAAYAQENIRHILEYNHDPQGTTMDLVPFNPRFDAYPFTLKYPARWFAREEITAASAGLFFTREPVKKVEDWYKTGVGIYVFSYGDDFDWGKTKEDYYAWISRKPGITVTGKQEFTLSGRPAMRMEVASDQMKMINLVILAGDKVVLYVTMEAPLEEYGRYRDVFEKIIPTFDFSVKPPA